MGSRRRGSLKRNKNRNQSKQSKRNQKMVKMARHNSDGDYKTQDSRRKTYQERPEIILEAPADFSIENNRRSVLKFFKDFDSFQKTHRIFVDLEHVNVITSDAILLLFLKLKAAKTPVRGSKPLDAECASILNDSGFYSKVRNLGPPMSRRGDFLQFDSGNESDPGKSDSVMQFCKSKGVCYESADATKLLITEMTSNTWDHAFKSQKKVLSHKWWVMARLLPDGAKVQVCILDNGMGIPKSMKSAYKELTNDLDEEIISSLIQNKYADDKKSRFKQRKRGKGLPKLLTSLQSGKLSSLRVLSGKGYFYSCINGNVETEEYKLSFPGTLVSWECDVEQKMEINSEQPSFS